MKNLVLLAACMAFLACGKTPSTPDPAPTPDPVPDPTPAQIEIPAFAKGADIGWASEMEAGGRTWKKKDGTSASLMEVLKDCGVNAIRLRVWVNPYKGWCGKDDVVAVAEKATAAGLPVMIDFHYSDFFADPSRQKIPAAWEADQNDMNKMVQHVKDHTKEVLTALKAIGVTVAWVQIGNETRSAMLDPLGKLNYKNKGAEFTAFVKLSNAGYDAAKEVFPSVKVMPHIDNAFDVANNTWWVNSFVSQGGKLDMIALSHYPQNSWDGDKKMDWKDCNAKAVSAIGSMASRFKVPVLVVEVGVKTPENTALAASVLQEFMDAVKAVDGCAGVFYWEPEVDGVWKPALYGLPAELSKYTGKSESAWGAYNMGAFTTSGQPTAVMDVFAK